LSEGLIGEPAGWFLLIEMARWLGVAPWDLYEHAEWIPYVLETKRLLNEYEAVMERRRAHGE